MATLKLNNGKIYELQHPWPEFKIQANGTGVVLGEAPYLTAFFEAFPREPSTFIRGEGVDVQTAENEAWEKYQRILACPNHEYKRHNNDGAGICIHCGLFQQNVLPCLNKCVICGKEAVHHYSLMTEDDLCYTHHREEIETLLSDGPLSYKEFIEKYPNLSSHYLLYQNLILKKFKFDYMDANNMIPNEWEIDDKLAHDEMDEYWRSFSRFMQNFIIVTIKQYNGVGISFGDLLTAVSRTGLNQELSTRLIEIFVDIRPKLIETKKFSDDFFTDKICQEKIISIYQTISNNKNNDCE